MTFWMSFLVNTRLISENGTSLFCGRISDKSMRPGVVSTILTTWAPVSSTVCRRAFTRLCRLTARESSACWISPMSPKIMPSPGSPSRSMVM